MKDCLTSTPVVLVTYRNATTYKRHPFSLQKLSFRTVKGILLQRKRHPFKFETTTSHNAYSFHQQARQHYDIQPYRHLLLTVLTTLRTASTALSIAAAIRKTARTQIIRLRMTAHPISGLATQSTIRHTGFIRNRAKINAFILLLT